VKAFCPSSLTHRSPTQGGGFRLLEIQGEKKKATSENHLEFVSRGSRPQMSSVWQHYREEEGGTKPRSVTKRKKMRSDDRRGRAGQAGSRHAERKSCNADLKTEPKGKRWWRAPQEGSSEKPSEKGSGPGRLVAPGHSSKGIAQKGPKIVEGRDKFTSGG